MTIFTILYWFFSGIWISTWFAAIWFEEVAQQLIVTGFFALVLSAIINDKIKEMKKCQTE